MPWHALHVPLPGWVKLDPIVWVEAEEVGIQCSACVTCELHAVV